MWLGAPRVRRFPRKRHWTHEQGVYNARCSGTVDEGWGQALQSLRRPVTKVGFPSEGDGDQNSVLRKDVMTNFYFERS